MDLYKNKLSQLNHSKIKIFLLKIKKSIKFYMNLIGFVVFNVITFGDGERKKKKLFN